MLTSIHSRIQIDEMTYTSPDPIVTGQQLLDMAGKRPSDQYLVYQLLKSGQMESLRPDETVDLRQPGIEKFLTFESDRIFAFVLDGRKFDWPAELITGHQLKKLAGVPATYTVWQAMLGAEDRKLADQDSVSLTAKGTERFFTDNPGTVEG
jgi:Multiubiquitin